jgi:hypothetical protein
MRNVEFRTGLMQDKSVTTIPARVFDPTRDTRWLLGVAALSFIGGVGMIAGGLLQGYALLLLGIVGGLAWDVRFRRRPRERTLVCKPGSIQTRGSGLIRARDIEGATTARVGDRVALVLAHRRRRRHPIILELANEDALQTVCKSLGIGHHGFGHIDFATQTSREEMGSRIFSVIGLLCILSFFTRVEPVIGLGVMGLLLSLVVVVSLAFIRRAMPQAFVRITSAGVFLPTGMFVPFHAIEDVQLLANDIVFRIKTERNEPELRLPIRCVKRSRHGLTREELEHMTTQIRAASERAHGMFRTKTAPEALAARLARNEGENDADWYARLDMLAIGGAGYRALSAEPAELWALLEDPEALADVRAGAARVLRRIDKDVLHVRVADVLATVRDERTRTRIADSIEEEDDERSPDSQSAAHS